MTHHGLFFPKGLIDGKIFYLSSFLLSSGLFPSMLDIFYLEHWLAHISGHSWDKGFSQSPGETKQHCP